MDQIEALPGLTQVESAKLKFAAENGVVFDDEMRGCVVRMIGAIQHPPEPVEEPKPEKATRKRKHTKKT